MVPLEALSPPEMGRGCSAGFPQPLFLFAGSGLTVETWGSQPFRCLLGKSQVSVGPVGTD